MWFSDVMLWSFILILTYCRVLDHEWYMLFWCNCYAFGFKLNYMLVLSLSLMHSF